MKKSFIRIRLWYEKASARVVTFFANRFLVWRNNNQTRIRTLFPTRRTEIFLSALPLALGIVSFFIVVGPRVLNPMNIAWLKVGDPATNYLGWLFFRDSPWTFPIGLNPKYGLELSSSILYSDSNVLLALLFKPFSSLLPTPFQYFGIWLLVCFCLQAWFSWKLIGLISDNVLIRLLGSGLFTFSPPMIARSHYVINLSSHFLIIAALYISFNPKMPRRRLSWGILLAVSAMVHPYLLVMTVLIWIADLSRRVFKEGISVWNMLTELAILLVTVGLVCWQAGYFSIDDGGSLAGVGFGYYRMNLLSILDSNGWSYLLKDIAAAEDREIVGFNYLGSGILLLLISVIPILIGSWSQFIHTVKKYLYLFILLLCLSVYAVSNNIGFGPLDFAYYYLPDSVLKVFGIVRASGRMFWPVFYIIIFSIIFLVVQMYKKRAIIFLNLAFIIQVVDTSPGWRELRRGLMTDQSRVWSTSLIDSFWKEAPEKYKKVRHIPPSNFGEGWKSLATYAGVNGLSTDAVYLSRVDNMAVTDAQQKASRILRSGDFEQDSLYILADDLLRRAAISMDKDSTLLAKIDGLNVIAPGWKSCAECSHIENEITLSDFLPPLKYDERIFFGSKDSGVYYLGDGWSAPEDWGTWSHGSSATIFLPIPPQQQIDSILIEANAFVSRSHNVIANQRLTVLINGITAADLVLSEPSPSITEPATVFEIKMPEAVKQKSGDKYFKLLFNFPDATSPRDLGLSDDHRELALGLVTLAVR